MVVGQNGCLGKISTRHKYAETVVTATMGFDVRSIDADEGHTIPPHEKTATYVGNFSKFRSMKCRPYSST